MLLGQQNAATKPRPLSPIVLPNQWLTTDLAGIVDDGSVEASASPACSPNAACPASGRDPLRSHSTGMSFLCSFCDEKFSSKARRDRHEKRHVPQVPKHQWVEGNCGKFFMSKETLGKHIRSVSYLVAFGLFSYEF